MTPATAAPRGAPGLDFQVPEERSAREPPEARGLARDGVRLMVSRMRDDRITHARFDRLPDFLAPGDVLVVNASATIAAALPATRLMAHGGEREVLLHLSTFLSAGRWIVELRRRTAAGHAPLLGAASGERFALPAGATAELLEPYLPAGVGRPTDGGTRLWVAALALPPAAPSPANAGGPRSDLRGVPAAALLYTARHGAPIRYGYVPRLWPLAMYQTLFACVPGSAEMPSAGRPFTPALLERLRRRGVHVAPLVLHTGVSSPEAHEPPAPERYAVPGATAERVNRARARGGRVVAVGTTAVRALETVAAEDGTVRPGRGWTDLVVTPERGMRAVDALVTGLHEPQASHLALLAALAGAGHLSLAYAAALRHGYLWHEFGDLHLLVP